MAFWLDSDTVNSSRSSGLPWPVFGNQLTPSPPPPVGSMAVRHRLRGPWGCIRPVFLHPARGSRGPADRSPDARLFCTPRIVPPCHFDGDFGGSRIMDSQSRPITHLRELACLNLDRAHRHLEGRRAISVYDTGGTDHDNVLGDDFIRTSSGSKPPPPVRRMATFAWLSCPIICCPTLIILGCQMLHGNILPGSVRPDRRPPPHPGIITSVYAGNNQLAPATPIHMIRITG